MTPQEIEALRIEALKDKVDAPSDMVDILKAERDALAAQVEYLKSHFNELIEIAQRCDSWESFPQKPLDRALAALQSLPRQCLRDVQTEAGRAGFVAGFSACFNYVGDMNMHDLSINYAAKVRQGGAE